MVALLAGGLEEVVAADQGHRPAQGFQIIAPAAGGAGVDAAIGDAAGAARPSTPGSPARTGSPSCPGGRAASAPRQNGSGIHVEILPVEVDALLRAASGPRD